ncbi:MAG: hypothetical protein ACRD9R_18680 [Pyrinomonadaceae bacterium]
MRAAKGQRERRRLRRGLWGNYSQPVAPRDYRAQNNIDNALYAEALEAKSRDSSSPSKRRSPVKKPASRRRTPKGRP